MIKEIYNTRGYSSETLMKMARENPKMQIRVIGGLDPKEQKRYDEPYYRNRTIHTPTELAKIVKEFENIEKGINPEWSQLEKALYIYQKLAKKISYDEQEKYNVGGGTRDPNRSLDGIVRKKSVCAGYSMIFKEMMDRNLEKSGVANILLSQERVKNKLENVGGYVGYMEKGTKFYQPTMEKIIGNYTR